MATASAEYAVLMLAAVLIERGMTRDELVAAFAELGLSVSPVRGEGLLDRLAELGLARVASAEGEQRRYVTTSLGQRQTAGLAAGRKIETHLAELERLRTELVSALAHELRTPLTTIRTSVGLLRDASVRPSTEETARLLANVGASAERMQRLIADVLDIARFRSGNIRLQPRSFDAVTLADDVARACADMLTERSQRLEIVAPAEPVQVYADRRRLEQVLVNLVSNASRFSPRDTRIELAVSAPGGDVMWSVRDEGPGIPEADRARLFERFFTADHRSHDQSGTGLGLPIALAIAEAHQGTIVVETELGRGSTFRLRIPAQILAAEEAR